MMKLIFDAMSGDNAPRALVEGAVKARRELGTELVLVGRKEEILPCLSACGEAEGPGISIVDARETVTMEDDPSTVIRKKKDSSMAVALQLLHEGQGDAVVSAGNTGALLTGATLIVKRIPGIRRAAMSPAVPNGGGGGVLIDCGANVVCKPEYLLQFAFMGSFYVRKLFHCPSPRVALLSNGAEPTKGAELQREAYRLLEEAAAAGRINFVGNIEGSDVFSDRAEVIVTDGFTGNVALKTVEGTAKYLMKNLKNVMMGSFRAKLGALLMKSQLRELKKLLDVEEVGGTAFLGISRCVIKAHGNSDAKAVFSAARQAVAFVEGGIIEDIQAHIDEMSLSGRDKEE